VRAFFFFVFFDGDGGAGGAGGGGIVTLGRKAACGAYTPWKLVRCTFAGGTRETRRRTSCPVAKFWRNCTDIQAFHGDGKVIQTAKPSANLRIDS
jgi:hypothetical protein